MHLKLIENAWRRLRRESVANIIARDAELLCHGSQVRAGFSTRCCSSAISTPETDCGRAHSAFGHEVAAAVGTVERRLNNTGQ